ncbi:MAG TPA: hypothetical protein VKS43_14280 [Burkholderiales bacterium]|jgi:hypothetical protein|nr:hypothetical protein [Burkholderiales bacterium]
MKKALMIAVTFAAFGLAGCVVVPAYNTPYGYGYGAPVVVAPAPFYGRYGYYRGGRGYY